MRGVVGIDEHLGVVGHLVRGHVVDDGLDHVFGQRFGVDAEGHGRHREGLDARQARAGPVGQLALEAIGHLVDAAHLAVGARHHLVGSAGAGVVARSQVHVAAGDLVDAQRLAGCHDHLVEELAGLSEHVDVVVVQLLSEDGGRDHIARGGAQRDEGIILAAQLLEIEGAVGAHELALLAVAAEYLRVVGHRVQLALLVREHEAHLDVGVALVDLNVFVGSQRGDLSLAGR